MKKLLLSAVLLCSFTVEAKVGLTLRFESDSHRQLWQEWYLDGGGEGHSGFYANIWNNKYMDLTLDIFFKEKLTEDQKQCLHILKKETTTNINN